MLISNKPRQVFSYVYTNPEVFDLLVKHLSDKSVSEVLQKLLTNVPTLS
jgi:hypothetical protein